MQRRFEVTLTLLLRHDDDDDDDGWRDGSGKTDKDLLTEFRPKIYEGPDSVIVLYKLQKFCDKISLIPWEPNLYKEENYVWG